MEFLAALVLSAEHVEVTEKINACRDSRDNKFLELAACGLASHIITGDEDLLVLQSFRNTAVVTPQAFVTGLAVSETER